MDKKASDRLSAHLTFIHSGVIDFGITDFQHPFIGFVTMNSLKKILKKIKLLCTIIGKFSTASCILKVKIQYTICILKKQNKQIYIFQLFAYEFQFDDIVFFCGIQQCCCCCFYAFFSKVFKFQSTTLFKLLKLQIISACNLHSLKKIA